jgi:hypothetical protein
MKHYTKKRKISKNNKTKNNSISHFVFKNHATSKIIFNSPMFQNGLPKELTEFITIR